MNNQDQGYDGALISELGILRYLKATNDIKVSNIDFLLRGAAVKQAWDECQFGCHGPSYRSLRRPSTKADILKPLDDVSPALAGIADGIHYKTIGQVYRLAGGVKRTAEGLHATGEENFQQVGNENIAVYEFARSAFNNLVAFEINLLENPVAQIVMTIVSEYTAVVPEWLLEECVKQGALKFPEKIDTVWLLKASAMGIIDNIAAEDIDRAAKLLNEPAQRFVAKQIGKKLAVVIAAAIASSITKKLLTMSDESNYLKRKMLSLRRAARKMNGGLGGALLGLLNTQGILNIAAESSRSLQKSNPRIWNILRYKLNGANMIYFLVEDMVKEYVDRLEVLERNPKEFGKLMEALIREKRTQAIFFPASAN